VVENLRELANHGPRAGDGLVVTVPHASAG
jgi:hypothetical protein